MSSVTKVRVYLITLLLLVGAVPFALSYLTVNELINYQSDIAQRLNLSESLSGYKNVLKEASKYNISKEAEYRTEFEKVHEKEMLLGSQKILWKNVKSSLKMTYLILFGAFTTLIVLVGFLISRIISRLYQQTHKQLQEEMIRTSYLKQFESLADVIKMMNHEIKKPLAPLELWLNQLVSSARNKDISAVEASVEIIQEEIGNLKMHLKAFNKFNSLPEPQIQSVEVNSYLSGLFVKFSEIYDRAIIQYNSRLTQNNIQVDKGLFSQVVQNLIENALEANLDSEKVDINIFAYLEQDYVQVDIKNKGNQIKDLESIFLPYFSTKDKAVNSGLGLTIAKATMIKHRGDLNALEYSRGAWFRLKIPTQTLEPS